MASNECPDAPTRNTERGPAEIGRHDYRFAISPGGTFYAMCRWCCALKTPVYT